MFPKYILQYVFHTNDMSLSIYFRFYSTKSTFWCTV